MAELIQREDSLNTGREKLNEAIKASERAEQKSDQAVNTSNEAKSQSQSAENKADNVQEQFNQVVIEGDSSVEAAQARVDSEGNTYNTLKERLDDKETEFSSQLAQTMKYPILFFEVGVIDKSYPYDDARRFGAKGDFDQETKTGTDDTEALKNALLSHDDIVLRDGKFLISSPLNVGYNKKLSCNNGGFLVSNSHTDMIKLEKQSKLVNVNIEIHQHLYEGDVIEYSSATMGNVDGRVAEIHDIVVEFPNQGSNINPGSILNIWTAKYNELDNTTEYTFPGMSYLNVYNIRVKGIFRYFCKFYTYHTTGEAGKLEGWLTSNNFRNIEINTCIYGFFGAKDEDTMNDNRYTMGGRNSFQNITHQGGVSEMMFYITGGTHQLHNIMPWDWKKWYSERVPIVIRDGSDTLLEMNNLPLRGSLLYSIKSNSYPSGVETPTQKEAYVKRFISKASVLEDVTQSYAENVFNFQKISGFNSGDVILLAETKYMTRQTLKFKWFNYYGGNVVGSQESDVILHYDETNGLRCSIYPYYDLSAYGEFYTHRVTIGTTEFIRYYFKCTSSIQNTSFYEYNNVNIGYLETRIAPFNPKKVTDVTDFTGMTKATFNGVDYIPNTPYTNNQYANKGALLFDPNKDMFMGKTQRGWKTLSELSAGYTVDRPTNAEVGYMFYDRSINKPIWKSFEGWVDNLSKFVSVPTSATATGNIGDWSADANYLYICHATNTWKRIAVSTW